MKTETKNKIDIGNATSKMIILCWVTIFVCNILKFFGYKEFEIPLFKAEINIWLQRIINLFLYNINSIFFFLLIIKRKPKKIECLIIFLIYTIIFMFSLYKVTTPYCFILEILSYICLGIIFIKDIWYKKILETAFISIMIMVYQIITMLYKGINYNPNFFEFIPNTILQVDYYMLLILTVINAFKKGGYLYGRFWKAILVLLSKRQCIKEDVQQNQNDVSQEIGYKLFIIVLSITQIFIVGVVCYFVNNVILEYFIIIISFFIMRQVFGKSYHADSVLACTTLSVIVFTIATRLPLPQWASILCNVFIGCMVAYVMYMWYYYAKYGTKEDIVIHNGMKREDLIYLCEKANLTKIATDRMIMKYVEGKTVKEIAEIESLEIDSIKSSLHRSRKAIQS